MGGPPGSAAALLPHGLKPILHISALPSDTLDLLQCDRSTAGLQAQQTISLAYFARDFLLGDVAAYRTISQYKWSVSRVGKKLYACTMINGRTAAIHRFLLRPRKGYQVDHIDGNGLNNCRSNLRVCTPQQNLANRGPRGGSSRFVGVSRRAGKWEAKIMYRGKRFYLGRFDDEVEAAKARDRKAHELHGPYAYLNFPEDFRR